MIEKEKKEPTNLTVHSSLPLNILYVDVVANIWLAQAHWLAFNERYYGYLVSSIT